MTMINGSAEVLRFLGSHEAALLQFIRDLIATPSPTPPGDERAVAARIQAELHRLQLGAATIIAAQPERPNLLLKLPGAKCGRSLIFCGHMDTKPPGNRSEWRMDPFDPTIINGRINGLGSGDMKAGIAAMIYAVAAVAHAKLPVGELQLLMTADEEGGSSLGSKFLAEGGHVRGDAMIITESSGVHREMEFLAMDSRGVCCFAVRFFGDQMHSSLSDEFKAVNASIKAGEILSRFAREFRHPGATVNAGVTLSGGVYYGVVPGMAEFGCDIRVPPGSVESEFRAAIEAWFEHQRQLDPQLRCEVVWDGPLPPWTEPVTFPRENPLAPCLEHACAAVLGKQLPVRCFPGCTDAPWFVRAGIPTIPALGPGRLPLAHSPNEAVEVASIHTCARIYALAAQQYLCVHD